MKKRAKDGLDDVFGVDATAEALADSLAGEAEEPVHIEIEQLSGGVFVPRLPAAEKGSSLWIIGHELSLLAVIPWEEGLGTGCCLHCCAPFRRMSNAKSASRAT
jgi:hypothetical protein